MPTGAQSSLDLASNPVVTQMLRPVEESQSCKHWQASVMMHKSHGDQLYAEAATYRRFTDHLHMQQLSYKSHSMYMLASDTALRVCCRTWMHVGFMVLGYNPAATKRED